MPARENALNHRLKRWIYPPSFADDRADFTGRIVHAWLVAVLGCTVFWVYGFFLIPASALRFAIMGTICFLLAAGLLALNRRNPIATAWITLAVFWLVASWAMATTGGTRTQNVLVYGALMILCALAFGLRGSLVMLLADVACLLSMAWAEVNGMLPPPQLTHTPYTAILPVAFGLALISVIIVVASDATQTYVRRADEELAKRSAAESQLRLLNLSLDESVEKLKGRVGQLEFVHRSANLVSWVWDLASSNVEWFGDRDELLGLPAGSFSGLYHDYFAALHPDDRAASRDTIRACLKGLRPQYRSQERLVLPDGGIRWVEVVGKGEYSADGRATRIAGVIRDITGERATNEAVAASERRYRGLFDSALDGIAIIGRDGTLLDVNPACCRETGFARNELVGRSFTDLFSPEDLQVQPPIYGILDHRASVMIERRIRRKDGSLIPVEINAWRLPDGNMQAIVRDTSERKRAEERFTKVFHVGPNAMIIVRQADGDIVEVNTAWEGVSGYSRQDTIGHNGRELGLWVDDANRERLMESMLQGGSVLDLEVLVRRKSGEIATVILAAEVMEFDGEPHMVVSINDVTERKRIEGEIVELNASLERRVHDRTAELQEANRELESFSYTISHDLRAPLRSILGFTQMLGKEHGEALPEGGHRYLARVEHSARRMGELIEDLLAFSRAGRGQLTQRPIGTRTLVAAIVADLDPNGVIELADLPDATGDPSLLRQVWHNLLANSLKFSRKAARPAIRVTGSLRADGMVEYAVEDNGCGFDMAHAGKLFGVFQRLHSEREYEGTGVGLAIVHRIVTRHGGQISASSRPNEGARFTFTLPH